jgi:chromosomal replication initiation ATPase DnaA
MFAVSGRFTERGIAERARAAAALEEERTRAERQAGAKLRADERDVEIRSLRERESGNIVVNAPTSSRPLVRDIIAQVAKRHRISPRDITGPRRNKKYIAARVEAIRIAADTRPDMSLTELGRIFQRDHSTIIHALNKTKTEGQAR